MIPIRNIEWQGRNLTKLGTNTFAYDGFGNRRRKNSIYFTYDSQGNLIEQSNGLHFMYDHTGVMGFTYQGQTYFYQKDLQGNIFAIVNASGVAVAFYHYDAWGNHKVYVADSLIEMTSPTFIGNLNPFRYRGYYYDTETKLYYLQSRYYDPEVGRFISADTVNYAEPSQFNGLNIYAYCNNNPVMYADPSGHYCFWIGLAIGALIGFAVSGTISAARVAFDGGSKREILAAFVSSGIVGAVLGMASFASGAIVALGIQMSQLAWCASLLGAATISFGAGSLSYYVDKKIRREQIDMSELFAEGALTAVQGAFSFGLGALLTVSSYWNPLKNGFSSGNKREAIWALAVRTFFKQIFVAPWNLIKP